MGFGRGPCPDGSLPIFSVDSEQEALDLLVLTCPTNGWGQYIAPELVQEQTLENLYKFGDRLRRGYAMLKARRSNANATGAAGSMSDAPNEPHRTPGDGGRESARPRRAGTRTKKRKRT